MKKIITLTISLLFFVNGYAQRVCGTMQHEQMLQQKNPKRAEQRKAYEKMMAAFMANAKINGNNQTQSINKIPLVVHVVYSSASDSVQDAQIFSQIKILNDDYTRQNADTVNTPAPFKAVAGAPMVQYCWAQRDPNGNPTNGIERRKSTTTSWTTDDAVKSYNTGGLDAWDPTRYFNIWVCNLGGNLLGYGEFPTSSPSNTYGFVAGVTCFGDTLLAQPPFDKGRTATHEIGHCFNLIHIWGDDGGACTGDDQCADTPNQASENYGCPTYPHTDACTTTSPGVMFMNYMDYTDDACMNIFTKDQSLRMVAIINNPPYNALLTSNACTPLVLLPGDAGVTNIISPNGSSCGGTMAPKLVIKDWGNDSLKNVVINYVIDNGTVQTYTWTGVLASLQTYTATLASITPSVGTHTFTAYTSLPNGVTDGNQTNDTMRVTFSILATGQALPLSEGFENTTYPPTGWTAANPDNSTTWARTTSAAKTGSASVYMANYNYQTTGQLDDITTPAVDLTSIASPGLSFQVAYELYTSPTANPNYSDTLQVLISTDCGATYTSIYKKYSTNLTTTTPSYATSEFVPTSSQWRLETISLGSYSSATAAFIKFRSINDYENDLFLDDINISTLSGIQAQSAAQGILVYPNPSADGKFLVDIKKDEHNVQRLSVYDVLGNKVFEIKDNIPAGTYDMNLSNLSSGTYLVEIVKDNTTVFNKIIINK
ncbi:MAG TPA: M43 family zinc metalloprotease [Bacteroidia bacterium]|nr:M43 family zinc metalloprotease [Bacteroidia bacterium]